MKSIRGTIFNERLFCIFTIYVHKCTYMYRKYLYGFEHKSGEYSFYTMILYNVKTDHLYRNSTSCLYLNKSYLQSSFYCHFLELIIDRIATHIQVENPRPSSVSCLVNDIPEVV